MLLRVVVGKWVVASSLIMYKISFSLLLFCCGRTTHLSLSLSLSLSLYIYIYIYSSNAINSSRIQLCLVI
jgi:hypothetical protein